MTGHLSMNCAIVWILVFSIANAYWTPCNYPVPSDTNFQDQCGLNYLKSTYVCDVDRSISITAVEKLDAALKNDLFSKENIRVGIGVLRHLQFPSSITFPQYTSQSVPRSIQDFTKSKYSEDFQSTDHEDSGRIRRHDPNAQLALSKSVNPDWYCLSLSDLYLHDKDAHLTNLTIVKQYIHKFADALRRRWFRDECSPDLFFFVITDSVVDYESGQKLLTSPVVRISYGQELIRKLPSGYDQNLDAELSALIDTGWTAQPIIVLALERIADALASHRPVQQTVTTVIVDSNGQYQVVTSVVVQHSIPAWAIYTFIGCLGSVGLALGLEWTIVRRKALTLRGGGGNGGGERHRSSKSDNVQVHLYF